MKEPLTAREVLELVFPEHKGHSVARWYDRKGGIVINCSCGDTLSAKDVYRGHDLRDGLRNAPRMAAA